MPKIVDHDERRRALAEAAWRVVARVGVDGATVREIARESGCSAGAISHYFATKDDILRSALEQADEHVRQRLAALPDDLGPLDALRAGLREALPLDERRRFELTLDVNFWARALNEPALRALQHADHDLWRRYVGKRVRAAQRAGVLTTAVGGAEITDVLVAFVDGIGVQALVYPELLDAHRVERLLDAQLRAFAGRAGPGER